MTQVNNLFRLSTRISDMLTWLRRRKQPIGRGLLAGLLGLWLAAAAAPCVAMTLNSETPSHPCTDMESVLDQSVACEQATAPDCALPDGNGLVAAAPDFSVTPVILMTVPAVAVAPTLSTPLSAWKLLQPAPLPLYLTHLALLF